MPREKTWNLPALFLFPQNRKNGLPPLIKSEPFKPTWLVGQVKNSFGKPVVVGTDRSFLWLFSVKPGCGEKIVHLKFLVKLFPKATHRNCLVGLFFLLFLFPAKMVLAELLSRVEDGKLVFESGSHNKSLNQTIAFVTLCAGHKPRQTGEAPAALAG